MSDCVVSFKIPAEQNKYRSESSRYIPKFTKATSGIGDKLNLNASNIQCLVYVSQKEHRHFVQKGCDSMNYFNSIFPSFPYWA